MLRRLVILSLFAWCLIGTGSLSFAQEGGERKFGKKNQRPEVEETEEPQENVNNATIDEEDDRPSFLPSKNIKRSNENFPQDGKGIKADSLNQATTTKNKPKEKNKYNILLYYIYKLKHEDSDNK